MSGITRGIWERIWRKTPRKKTKEGQGKPARGGKEKPDRTEGRGASTREDKGGAPSERGLAAGERGLGNNVIPEYEEDLEEEDLKGYETTPGDHSMQEVYIDWVNANIGSHLTGGIGEDNQWQMWWQDLTVLPLRRYDVLGRKVGRRFIRALAADLTGF